MNLGKHEQETLLRCVDPGQAPCDCCVNHGGVWWDECDCQNYGDKGEAAQWCALKNATGRLTKEIGGGYE